MPVYEYACQRCGHEFEREQRISEAPVKKCPKCGALKAKRLISRTSFVLKGGGWYSDLYGSAKPKSESAEKGAAEGAEAASAKTEPASGGTDKAAGEKSDKKDPGKGKGKAKARAEGPRPSIGVRATCPTPGSRS